MMIAPYRGCFNRRLRQLWRCRDLITILVWRDFVSAYKETIFGPCWHIVQTLTTGSSRCPRSSWTLIPQMGGAECPDRS